MIFSNSVTACGAAAGDRSEGGSSSDGGGEVGSLHRKASKLKLNHGGGVGGGLNRYFPAATSDPDIAGLVTNSFSLLCLFEIKDHRKKVRCLQTHKGGIHK